MDIIQSVRDESELFDLLEEEYGDYFLNLEASKPVCRFGKDCYRRNTDHLAEFSHPAK